MQAPIQKKTRRFYDFAPYRLYVEGDLHRDGAPVPLPPKSIDVLIALVSRHGRVATKQELLREVWPDTFVEESSLTYQISQLRKTFGERPDGLPYIETATKRGYRFTVGVTESWAGDDDDAARPQVVGTEKHPQRAQEQRAGWLLWAVVLASVLTAGVYLGSRLAEGPKDSPLRKFTVSPPIAIRSNAGLHPNVAVSNDGSRIAFVSVEESRLWVHDLELAASHPLEGTEGADDPFWSPDGKRIGYFSGSRILAVPVEGGPAAKIYQREGASDQVFVDGRLRGASWSPDGNSIVFSENGNLFEVPARGGQARMLIDSDEAGGIAGPIRWPHFLPDSAGRRALLYTSGTTQARKIIVHNLDSGERKTLQSGELPSYSPSGHILYQAGPQDYDLWALPFSADQLAASDDPFRVKRDARYPMSPSDGSLIYLVAGSDSKGDRIAWADREGRILERFGDSHGQILHIQLSPDGKRAAVSAFDDGNQDIWIYDLERVARTRFTTHPEMDSDPTWSPDGTQIAFASRRTGSLDIYLAPADLSSEPSALRDSPGVAERPSDWTGTPNVLIYWRRDESGRGLLAVPISTGQSSVSADSFPLVQDAILGSVSPDGRSLAYWSNRSGQQEVYVRSYPSGEHQVQISTDGGSQPRWSNDGTEIFYVRGDSLMATPFSYSNKPSAGVPKKLFDLGGLHAAVSGETPGVASFDVSPDGTRFLVRERPTAANSTITVVQNWFKEFRNQR